MKSKQTMNRIITKYILFGFLLSIIITFTLLTIFFEPTHDWEQIEHHRAKINIDIALTIFLNFILTFLTCSVFLFKMEKIKMNFKYRVISLFGLPLFLILIGIYFNRKDHDDFVSYSLTAISYLIGHFVVYYFYNKAIIETKL
jgi:hypothetical protein